MLRPNNSTPLLEQDYMFLSYLVKPIISLFLANSRGSPPTFHSKVRMNCSTNTPGISWKILQERGVRA